MSPATAEPTMSQPTSEILRQAKCVPCEGGVPVIEKDAMDPYMAAIPLWSLAESGKAIERKVPCKHFVAAMKLLNDIAAIAEDQQHHPDLHLTGYRNVRIELTTHAIGGLSENDFIIASKIDELL